MIILLTESGFVVLLEEKNGEGDLKREVLSKASWDAIEEAGTPVVRCQGTVFFLPISRKGTCLRTNEFLLTWLSLPVRHRNLNFLFPHLIPFAYSPN